MAGREFFARNGLIVNNNILVVNTSTSSVGVGTGAPTSNLHVVGTANITTSLRIAGVDILPTLQSAYNHSNMVVTIVTTSTIITPDVSNDQIWITGLTTNANIYDPIGANTSGQLLLLKIKDDGNSRILTWNSVYRSIVTLPSNTTNSKISYVGLIYNSTDNKWDCIAVTTQP